MPYNGLPDRGADEYSISDSNQPPVISQPPESRSVLPGADLTFAVTAVGTTALSYQWRKAGTALSGASTNFIELINVSTNDAGSYDVVVTNGFGSATRISIALARRFAFRCS